MLSFWTILKAIWCFISLHCFLFLLRGLSLFRSASTPLKLEVSEFHFTGHYIRTSPSTSTPSWHFTHPPPTTCPTSLLSPVPPSISIPSFPSLSFIFALSPFLCISHHLHPLLYFYPSLLTHIITHIISTLPPTLPSLHLHPPSISVLPPSLPSLHLHFHSSFHSILPQVLKKRVSTGNLVSLQKQTTS